MMTVGDLRQKLKDVPDDAICLIPYGEDIHDGYPDHFYTIFSVKDVIIRELNKMMMDGSTFISKAVVLDCMGGTRFGHNDVFEEGDAT